jgi:hypothetical protein
MNLQEQTNRIKQVMGVINENKIVKMINDLGLYDTIHYLGGYDNLKRIMGDYTITREEKINFIIEKLSELAIREGQELDDGLWFNDINIEKLIYDETPDEYSLMELAYPHYVVMYIYRKDGGGQEVGTFKMYYDGLPDRILNELFNRLT